MGHASRADRTVLPTFSAGNQLEGDGGGSHTTNDAVATSVGGSGTKTGKATERLLQVWRFPYAAGLSPRQQTAASHSTNKGGKRAVSQTSADSDRKDGWTVVKR